MPKIFALIVVLVLTSVAHAETDIKKFAEFQAFHVEKTVEAIDLALRDAGEIIERNPDEDVLVLHQTLAKYVERTPGLRAIIVTDGKGKLRIDSFTYPAKDINLADREYVKYALNAKDRSLYIGTPLVGRSSGAAFVPFARPLLDIEKMTAFGAVAGIIHPGFLIKQDTLCPQCFVSLISDKSEVLVTYPSNVTYPAQYIAKIMEHNGNDVLKGVINEQDILTQVVTLKGYSIRVAVSKFPQR